MECSTRREGELEGDVRPFKHEEECSICAATYSHAFVASCLHYFCTDCVKKFRNCPTCRKQDVCPGGRRDLRFQTIIPVELCNIFVRMLQLLTLIGEEHKDRMLVNEHGESLHVQQFDMILEYVRFLRLKLMARDATGGAFAPSVRIDRLWRYHILDTQQYPADVSVVSMYYRLQPLHLHYNPYVGHSRIQFQRDQWRRRNALRLFYRSTFHMEPRPAWVWTELFFDEKKPDADAIKELEEATRQYNGSIRSERRGLVQRPRTTLLSVQTAVGRFWSIAVSLDYDTVYDLKILIEMNTGIDTHQQCLLFEGIRMRDNNLLKMYSGLGQFSLVQIAHEPRGRE